MFVVNMISTRSSSKRKLSFSDSNNSNSSMNTRFSSSSKRSSSVKETLASKKRSSKKDEEKPSRKRVKQIDSGVHCTPPTTPTTSTSASVTSTSPSVSSFSTDSLFLSAFTSPFSPVTLSPLVAPSIPSLNDVPVLTPILSALSTPSTSSSSSASSSTPLTSSPRSNKNVASPVSYLKEQEIKEYKLTFRVFDKDRDGRLSAEDLKTSLYSVGVKCSMHEIKKMIDEVDDFGVGYLDETQFLTLMARKKKDIDFEDEIKRAFEAIDSDKNGHITSAELEKALKLIGEDPKADLLEALMKKMHASVDQQIGFKEFRLLFRD